MLPRIAAVRIGIAMIAIVAAAPRAALAGLPPGRPYVLTIKGDSTITFVPEAGLAPLPIDYKARVEYLVNSRSIEATAAREPSSRKKMRRKGSSRGDHAQPRPSSDDGNRPSAAVDLALHSAEITLRHRGQVVVQSRINRARFQGRLLPDAPILNVSYNQAPPRLQQVLATFDKTGASILLDDRANVLTRRVRDDGPLHAIIETLLSIHTPIPGDLGSWEAPTQLAMGHGQTAGGTLRFAREKPDMKPDVKPTGVGGAIVVKVSGVLEAEGAIAGNFIKDGTYMVTGEQTYDSLSRQWTSARWSVEIRTTLVSQGVTVAHGQGKMLVESRAWETRAATRRDSVGKP